MKTILIIGGCGTGKTWLMKELIKSEKAKPQKMGLISWNKFRNTLVLGKYTGKTFDGGDALSMAVAKDFPKLRKYQETMKINIIAEGDRFTNSTFIGIFNPYIIKIDNDGSWGRNNRKSSQTEQHIKRIQSRVNNTKYNIAVKDSAEALKTVKKLINENT